MKDEMNYSIVKCGVCGQCFSTWGNESMCPSCRIRRRDPIGRDYDPDNDNDNDDDDDDIPLF